MIQFILIVSIVARIGIPQFWIVQLMTCSLGCNSQNWSIADGSYKPEWIAQRLEDCPRIHGNAQESRNPFAILSIVKDCVRFGNWLKIQLHCIRIAKKCYNPRIAVEFRNGPAIHTIFMQCFQSSCNPFHTCNSDAIQIYCARHSRIVCQLWIDSKMTWIRCEKSCFLRLVCNPRNFYAMLSINLQSFIDSQSWCNSN